MLQKNMKCPRTPSQCANVGSPLEALQNLRLLNTEAGTEIQGILHGFESPYTRDQFETKKHSSISE